MPELIGVLAGVLIMALMIWIIFVLPANMAAKRGRSPGIWVLISLVGSPPLAILLLIALGDAPGRQYEEPSDN